MLRQCVPKRFVPVRPRSSWVRRRGSNFKNVLVEGTLHVHLNAGSGTTAEGIHQRAQASTIHGSRLTVPSRVGGRVSLCAFLLHLVKVAMQEFVLVRLLLPGVLEPFLGLQGVGCHLL